MSDPLIDAANAISGSSPNVKRFAQLAASRIIEIEQDVAKLSPPPPQPAPIFTQGYTAAEVTELSQMGAIVAPKAYSVEFPDAKTARFELHPGDVYLPWGAGSNERAQIQLPSIQVGDGDTWAWRFTVTLGNPYPFSASPWNVIWEHHHTSTTGSPPCTLQLNAGRWWWTNAVSPDPAQGNTHSDLPLAAAAAGGAYLFEITQAVSTDPAKAKTLITLNGVQVLALTGKPNCYTGLRLYPQFGIYRGSNASNPVQVLTFSPIERLA